MADEECAMHAIQPKWIVKKRKCCKSRVAMNTETICFWTCLFCKCCSILIVVWKWNGSGFLFTSSTRQIYALAALVLALAAACVAYLYIYIYIGWRFSRPKSPQDSRLTIAQLIKCANCMCRAQDVLQTMCVCKYLEICGRNTNILDAHASKECSPNFRNDIVGSGFLLLLFFFAFCLDIVLRPQGMRGDSHHEIPWWNRDAVIVINVELLWWSARLPRQPASELIVNFYWHRTMRFDFSLSFDKICVQTTFVSCRKRV